MDPEHDALLSLEMKMSDELQAAAERIKKTSGLKVVPQEGLWFSREDFTDMRSIINDWLAEHPAAGAEPVTEEWLENRDLYEGREFSDDHRIRFSMEGSLCIALICGTRSRKVFKNRGDVIAFCKALGIPLTA